MTTPTPRTWLSFSALTFLFHHLVYLNGFTAQMVKFLAIPVFPPPWSQQCCMPFWTQGLTRSIICSVSSNCLVHIQIVPIMPDLSVHHNYSELPISSRPTCNHYLTLQISDFRSETRKNFKSFRVVILLQYLNNVSKIDLRKIACLLFATPCLAVALPSLAVSTKWNPGRGQSLPQILQYESNHTSALRRVEKLHQRVRKHRMTYP